MATRGQHYCNIVICDTGLPSSLYRKSRMWGQSKDTLTGWTQHCSQEFRQTDVIFSLCFMWISQVGLYFLKNKMQIFVYFNMLFFMLISPHPHLGKLRKYHYKHMINKIKHYFTPQAWELLFFWFFWSWHLMTNTIFIVSQRHPTKTNKTNCILQPFVFRFLKNCTRLEQSLQKISK